MRKNLYKYLREYSTNPFEVDRLIISAFILKNTLSVNNNIFLKSYIIQDNKSEIEILENFCNIIDTELAIFDFEVLIELFEFVISPADRIITGAIYTPISIREYITSTCIDSITNNLSEVKVSDIACGCGGFLYNATLKLKEITGRTFYQIFNDNIFGLDIQPYSITRTKLLLSLLAISNGEDIAEFNFNLHVADALDFKWSKVILEFKGFDIILGNPPYVRSRHLDDATRKSLKQIEVCRTGNTDLYIPFFQIGIENLSPDGILGYITMNSFFKSLNGRALREYFQNKSLAFEIIDFGTRQIFKSRSTYTCICFIKNTIQNSIKYYKFTGTNVLSKDLDFSHIDYGGLNSIKGWNLNENVNISKIEATGKPFKEIYTTRHGIATLKNDIYIFKPIDEDDKYYYLKRENIYKIEKGICRDIINSNRLSRRISLDELREKVIFPYNDKVKPSLLEEKDLKENYPFAYKYLASKREVLKKRDNENGKYENWFAFGRNQSLEKMKNKMFFPKFSDIIPSYIINTNDDLLFYNGLAIIGECEEDLRLVKKIMETKLFWYYIKSTSKPYSSNYYSLNGTYINNFGICELNDSEKDFVLKETDRNILDVFFEKKYDVII